MTRRMRINHRMIASLMFAMSVATGCSNANGPGGSSGTLSVLLDPEATIIDGVQAGAGVEDIGDGWAVSYDRFIVTVGEIEVELRSDEAVSARSPDVFVVDMTEVPAAGPSLWTLRDLEPGRYDFGYATPKPTSGAERHESVSPDDFGAVTSKGWTYLIDGTLEKADGRSCPPSDLADAPEGAAPAGTNGGGEPCYGSPHIRFTFGMSADTRFGPCEIDGVPGFAIAGGETETVAATLHGDHLFFKRGANPASSGWPSGWRSAT